MKLPKFPLKVSSGSVVVTIYREVKKGGYVTFRLIWKQAGKKMSEQRADLDEAMSRANDVAELIEKGKAEMTDLTALDREIYNELNKKIKHTGYSLSDIVDKFLLTWEPDFVDISVEDAFAQYQLSRSDKSEYHKRDIRVKLGRVLKPYFKRKLSELKEMELRADVKLISTNKRTQNNHLMPIKAFLNYCQDQKLISRKVDHVLTWVKPETVGPKKGDNLTTSKDLKRIFEIICETRDDAEELMLILGFMSLMGVRVNECRRLTWENVLFEKGKAVALNIGGDKAKTKFNRGIPINESMQKIFEKVTVKESGSLTSLDCPDRLFAKIAKKEGIKWPTNCMRKTYITHELERTQNMEKVAYLAGTSPKMIKNYYRGITKETTEGAAWFSVTDSLPLTKTAKERILKVKNTPTLEGDSTITPDRKEESTYLPDNIDPTEGNS